MLHIKQTLKSKTTSHLFTYLFICTVLSFPLSAFASPTWLPFDLTMPEGSPPEITVLDHNSEHTLLEINIPGMWVEEVYEVGEVFQRLEIPEYQTILDIGRPALPAIGEFVGYLEPSENRIYFEDLETLVLDDYLVYPAQTPQTDQPTSMNMPFDYDWEFYQEDTWYPEERANVSDTKILREVCIAHTGIVPFDYNPAQRELVVNYRIMVDVLHHPGGLGLDGWMIPLGADPTFVNMYRGLIVNYEWLGLGEFDTTSGYDYLIVTHSEFLNNANMMADHLITQGYSVYVQVKDTTDWLQIYNTIKDFYNNNFNDYVLLFGDVGYIPIPIRQWKNPVTGYYIDIPSDMVYAGITGDDVFPEVAVGRLSVNNVTQARIQVRKNIFHYLYWDPDKELRCLLVSHKEQDYVDCKNDVYDFDYQMYQPFFVKVYGNWDWVYNKHIIYFLEYGERIVNYRGHGSKVAWADWNTYGQNFDFSCIDDTRLGNNRPAVFSITCLTGDITYGECF